MWHYLLPALPAPVVVALVVVALVVVALVVVAKTNRLDWYIFPANAAMHAADPRQTYIFWRPAHGAAIKRFENRINNDCGCVSLVIDA